MYEYFFFLRNHFRGLSYFILGVHSVSSLLEPMEVNSFYHKTDSSHPSWLCLVGNYSVFYGPWRLWRSVVTIPQVQLTGSRSSWVSELYERTRLPFPRLLMSGIHRGNGAWQSPPAPQPVEEKCSFSGYSFRVKGLNQPMLSLFESHIWTCTHCHGYSIFVCFFVSIPTLVLSALVTDQLLLLQTSRCSLCVWSSRKLRSVCLRTATPCV